MGKAFSNFVDNVAGVFDNMRKIVFFIIAGSVIAFTATGVMSGDDFMKLALMVFTFYFSKED